MRNKLVKIGLWLLVLSVVLLFAVQLNQIIKYVNYSYCQIEEQITDIIKSNNELLAMVIAINNRQNNLSEQIINNQDTINRESQSNQELSEIVNSISQRQNKLANQIVEANNIKNQEKQTIKNILNSSVVVFGLEGMGSGTVIKKTPDNMYILTCAHVIADLVKVYKTTGIKLGASVGYLKENSTNENIGVVTYGAEIIKYNRKIDLALLKVSINDDNLYEIKIAEKNSIKGDTIYVVGNPLGIIRTISKGILSNINEHNIISDATLTFGNSGGGLFNEQGELIGVPASVLAYAEINGAAIPESSLGYSVGLETIKKFVQEIFDGK